MNRKNGGEKTAPKLTKKILAEAQEMPKTGVFLHHFSLFWAHTPSSNIFLQKHADYKHTRRCRLFRSPPPTHRDTHTHKRERERDGAQRSTHPTMTIRLHSRSVLFLVFEPWRGSEEKNEWFKLFAVCHHSPPPFLPPPCLHVKEQRQK